MPTSILEIEVNLQDRKLILHTSAGETIKNALPQGILHQDTNIERFALNTTSGELTIGLPQGNEVTVELCTSERPVARLRAGRQVVYLDQNHWSTIAAARFGHREVSTDEAQAAHRLAELVEAKQILLPVSGANLVEATPLYGDRRTFLANTMLQLSRGWQMRNPLHVRVEELLGAVQGQPPTASNVFAPHTDELFRWSDSSPASINNADGSLAELVTVVPEILGLYDSVVDAAAIPDEGGIAKAAAEAWANKFAVLAKKLHAANESPEMYRRVANGNLIADLVDDVVLVAGLARITSDEVIARLTTPEDPIAQMPFLAQMRHQLYSRLRNKTQRWEANDLIDVLFLSCAAGYADIVVGERRTIGYLRNGREPRPRANLSASLMEAVELLS